MDRGSVTSGAAFKAAFRATLLFAAIVVVASFVAYNYVQLELRNSVISQVLDDQDFLQGIYQDAGQDQLIETIDQINHSKVGKPHALALFGQNGEKLVGNVDVAPGAIGWSEASLVLQPSDGAKVAPVALPYQVLSAPLDQMTLVIGISLADVSVQEVRMIEAFVTMGLALSVAFLTIGYLGSLQSYRKLEQMADTLNQVSRGDTGSRLAVSVANDQIDRVSRAMNLHLDRLSALMATTKASAAAIAHDLRTPLSRAVLAVDRALELPETAPQTREVLEEVEGELTRLHGIFDAILRISRLETNASSIAVQPVNLAALLDDLGETFGPVAEDNGQSFAVDTADPTLAALTDGEMLTQLLANLIQNAINHCPSGSAITLGATARDGKAVVFVSDTGPGIPRAERKRVFEMFYQVDQNRAKGGNGLGLALVKAIADRLGATLRLMDAEPGLRVEVTLDSGTAVRGRAIA